MMDPLVFEKIAVEFGWPDITLNSINTNLHPLESGLINNTWKLITHSDIYILQRVNTSIFKHPEWIDQNINNIADYLQMVDPGYLFTTPVKTQSGKSLIFIDNEAYRSFKFISNTHTISVINNELEAEEASRQFAMFTQKLIHYNIKNLYITLPDFHNLEKRYHQFTSSIQENNSDRLHKAQYTIQALLGQNQIVNRYIQFINHKDAHLRVTHHDTKISNVLFDEVGKGLCVIDLDTVMPGYFYSDAGDMFRTYLSPVSEEETDLEKIYIRKNILKAIENGYFNTLTTNLSSFEKDNFYLSGEILMYMQSIRFLTDYLQNDRYYGKKYPDHNLVRAQNQLRLLQLYQEAIH